jgi:hypothetical protein
MGAVPETVTVRATDAEGVSAVHVFVRHRDEQVDLFSGSLPLVGGTTRDGTWQGTFTIPGGAAPGTYVIQLMVIDDQNAQSWFSPEYTGMPDTFQRLIPAQAPTGTTILVQ